MKYYVKSLNSLARFVICIALLLCTTSQRAFAQNINALKDLTMIGHHFATTVRGQERFVSSSDPAKGRQLVVKLSAENQNEITTIFASDFVLVYKHQDGNEDRAVCDAIATSSTEKAGEFDDFNVGYVPRIRVKEGKVYFGLTFYVEPDVNQVELYRIGNSLPISYNIGRDRQYSVFLTSNRGIKQSQDVKDVIEAGDYNVHFTEGLNKDIEGITIYYTDKAETQAREISQRIMTKLGVTPKVKKSDFRGSYDIVVWFGKSDVIGKAGGL